MSSIPTSLKGGHGRLLAQTVATAAASPLAAVNHTFSTLIIIIVVVSLALVLVVVFWRYTLWRVQRQQSLSLTGTPMIMIIMIMRFLLFQSSVNHNSMLSSWQDDTAMNALSNSITTTTTTITTTTTTTRPRRVLLSPVVAAVPSAPLSYVNLVYQSITHPLLATSMSGSIATDAGRNGRHSSFWGLNHWTLYLCGLFHGGWFFRGQILFYLELIDFLITWYRFFR